MLNYLPTLDATMAYRENIDQVSINFKTLYLLFQIIRIVNPTPAQVMTLFERRVLAY
jgi:hypothetical protein